MLFIIKHGPILLRVQRLRGQYVYNNHVAVNKIWRDYDMLQFFKFVYNIIFNLVIYSAVLLQIFI